MVCQINDVDILVSILVHLTKESEKKKGFFQTKSIRWKIPKVICKRVIE